MAGTHRVLIIDDDDLVAVALFEHLTATAIAVDLATNLTRAQELIRAHVYTLIVVDAYMTGVLGDRAAALLQTIARLCPDAQIVLLSAYGSEDMARSIPMTRPIAVLAKPQPVARMARVVADLMSGVPA